MHCSDCSFDCGAHVFLQAGHQVDRFIYINAYEEAMCNDLFYVFHFFPPEKETKAQRG